MKKLFIASQLLTLAFLGIACSSNRSISHSNDDPPLGLWVWNIEQADNLVSISIVVNNDTWTATVNGIAAGVSKTQQIVTVKGDDGHKFVGEITTDGAKIVGYWHQPETVLDYSHMVTPLSLKASGVSSWQGGVVAQPRPFNMFLDIFEKEENGTFAVLRNPERNAILSAAPFQVSSDGNNRWTLFTKRGNRERRLCLERINETELRLFDHDWFETPLTMRPTTDIDRVRYYSRVLESDQRRVRYVPPKKLNDGWTTVRAEEVGFDRVALDALVTELASSDPRSSRPKMIHSVLVAYKGHLVFEEYFNGYDHTIVHDTRSLSKVFSPVLIGALQQQGYPINANIRPIPDVLKKANKTLDDPRKAEITLANLMTFSSGLDCDVNRDSLGSEDRMWGQIEEDDFWVYTAALPALYDPGQRYAYCSGSINLVGASLRSIGGAPIIDLFDRLIAKPLQFRSYHWNLAPNGAAYLGGGVYMHPRDILKIGVMFASGGKWNGKQIMPKSWVEEATTAKIAISPETTGLSPDEFSNNYFAAEQAYEWQVDTIIVDDKNYRSYQAAGNGGQVVLVVPELELVAVFTGGNYQMGGIWGRWKQEIIGGHIIPALQQ